MEGGGAKDLNQFQVISVGGGVAEDLKIAPHPGAEGPEGAAGRVFFGGCGVEDVAAGARRQPEVLGGVDPVSPVGVFGRRLQHIGRVFEGDETPAGRARTPSIRQ